MPPSDVSRCLRPPCSLDVSLDMDDASDRFYVAVCPGLGGCVAQDATPAEALGSLRQATRSYAGTPAALEGSRAGSRRAVPPGKVTGIEVVHRRGARDRRGGPANGNGGTTAPSVGRFRSRPAEGDPARIVRQRMVPVDSVRR